MSLPVAIIAGGLATRLRPITERIPKALVDVAGEPFIARQLRYLQQQGICDAVLCLGYLGEQVQAVVGGGEAFGLNVRYSWDGPTQIGTGGALRKALPLLGEAFFVLYGDSYLPIDFGAVEKDFIRQRKPTLMTVLRNQNQWDQSNVLLADGKLIEYNKRTQKREMTHIDYGLTVLSAEVFHGKSPREPHDLSDLYHELSLSGQMAYHEVFERFYEIGSPQGLIETSAYFTNKII